MDKLKLEQVDKNDWQFVWPRSSDKATELFYEALDYADAGKFDKATQLLNKAIELFPEHIDVLNHLSMFSRNKKEAVELNEKAVNIGLNCFTEKFNENSLLEWGWTENRPFLRAYHNKGLIVLNQGKTDEAIKLFKQIISWNPNDNQGIRDLLADIYINNQKWEDMIKLSKKYPDDYDPSMNFGLALALYKKNEKEKAVQQLKKAYKNFPLCGKILLLENPKEPKPIMPGCISVGGPDQAYEFWKEQAKAWKEDEIKKWLKSIIM